MNALRLAREERSLLLAWERHDADHLDEYLVAGVEDPRINAQSILTRALLIDRLFPGRFTREIEAEFRFGAVMTWLQGRLQAGAEPYALLDAISTTADTSIPAAIRETYRWLQSGDCALGDYMTGALDRPAVSSGRVALNPDALDTFTVFWRRALPAPAGTRLPVLEVACGSANDYRFMDAPGLAGHLDYTGLDLCRKNIANARRRFPGVRFIEGSALSSGLAARSRDIVFVHDLLEHLSGPAIEVCLGELARIARDEIWIHLFQATPAPAHEIRPTAAYHVNRISLPAAAATLREHGFEVEAFFIGHWIGEKFGVPDHYNSAAASLLATRVG